MIPIKDKKYAIAFLGYHGYDAYRGIGTHNGESEEHWVTDDKKEIWYGFIVPEYKEVLWFAEEDILTLVP